MHMAFDPEEQHSQHDMRKCREWVDAALHTALRRCDAPYADGHECHDCGRTQEGFPHHPQPFRRCPQCAADRCPVCGPCQMCDEVLVWPGPCCKCGQDQESDVLCDQCGSFYCVDCLGDSAPGAPGGEPPSNGTDLAAGEQPPATTEDVWYCRHCRHHPDVTCQARISGVKTPEDSRPCFVGRSGG
jgi:hypothetical protein